MGRLRPLLLLSPPPSYRGEKGTCQRLPGPSRGAHQRYVPAAVEEQGLGELICSVAPRRPGCCSVCDRCNCLFLGPVFSCCRLFLSLPCQSSLPNRPALHVTQGPRLRKKALPAHFEVKYTGTYIASHTPFGLSTSAVHIIGALIALLGFACIISPGPWCDHIPLTQADPVFAHQWLTLSVACLIPTRMIYQASIIIYPELFPHNLPMSRYATT